MADIEFNSLRDAELNRQAALGLNGIRRIKSNEESKTGETFLSVVAMLDSSFTCDLGGGGDDTFTGDLDKGSELLLPMSKITAVTGDLIFYRAKK
jgi:hypothetical protein